jgi:hypothetical protein
VCQMCLGRIASPANFDSTSAVVLPAACAALGWSTFDRLPPSRIRSSAAAGVGSDRRPAASERKKPRRTNGAIETLYSRGERLSGTHASPVRLSRR